MKNEELRLRREMGVTKFDKGKLKSKFAYLNFAAEPQFFIFHSSFFPVSHWRQAHVFLEELAH